MKVRVVASRLASSSLRRFIAQQARGHAPAIAVRRQETPYWQQQGWKREGQSYTGNYQTPFGAFFGRVYQRSAQELEFYMFQPPAEIQHHSHWSCFQARAGGWYLIHMSRQPKDVSSGILAVERLLIDAFEA